MVETTTALLNEWAGLWGPYLLLAVVQNVVFLAIVFLTLHLMRRSAARVLSLIATVGVIKLAIPPFLPLGWLPTQPAEQVVHPVATLLFPFAESVVNDSGFTAGITGGLSPLALLMMIWASIVVARLGYGLLQTLQLALDIRAAERVDDRDVPEEVLRAGLSVWKSGKIALPLTLGIRPRRIFVPPTWDSWSAACRRSALLHELAHVRRRDGVMQTVEIVVQAVFFFLPPVTWLVRRLHTYREMACDDASVASDPRSRLDYSRFLCSLAESMLERPLTASPTASASTLARRKGELLDRVAYQVKEGAVKSTNRKQLILVLAVLVFCAMPLSLVYGGKPKAKPAPPAPPAKTKAMASAAPIAVKEILVPAEAPKPKEAPPLPHPTVRVAITGEKHILVDGKPVKAKDFKKAVKVAVGKQGGKAIINIDGDGGISMKQLHAIQGDLNEMGLRKILYSGELGEAVPMVLPPDEARKRLSSMPEKKLIRVHVDGQGVIVVRDQRIKGAQLPDLIQKLLAVDERQVVILHTEPDTKYGAFVQVLNDLKKGGANKIAIPDPGD